MIRPTDVLQVRGLRDLPVDAFDVGGGGGRAKIFSIMSYNDPTQNEFTLPMTKFRLNKVLFSKD